MPLVDASVQDRPFGLVQMACGPTASQPAGAAGEPGGRIPERRLAAARRADRGQSPAGAAVGGHEELLPDHAVAGLGAHRDDRVPRGHDAVHGLEHAALLLPGIHADGQRRLRRGALVRGLVRLLVRGQLAELRAVAGEQGEGQDGHRDQDDDRHHDGGGAPADQAAPGAGTPGPGQFGFQEQGVVPARVMTGRERVRRLAPQGGCGAGGAPGVAAGEWLAFRVGHQAGPWLGVRLERLGARRVLRCGSRRCLRSVLRCGSRCGLRLGEDRRAERDPHVARPGAVHRLWRHRSRPDGPSRGLRLRRRVR